MTRQELIEKMNGINRKMREIMNDASKKEEFDKLQNEREVVTSEINAIDLEAKGKEMQRNAPRDVNAQLRELAKQSAGGQVSREISYAGQITDSGAINLTIKDLIGTLEERPGEPHNLKITYGGVGNEL